MAFTISITISNTVTHVQFLYVAVCWAYKEPREIVIKCNHLKKKKHKQDCKNFISTLPKEEMEGHLKELGHGSRTLKRLA